MVYGNSIIQIFENVTRCFRGGVTLAAVDSLMKQPDAMANKTVIYYFDCKLIASICGKLGSDQSTDRCRCCDGQGFAVAVFLKFVVLDPSDERKLSICAIKNADSKFEFLDKLP
jgi:hypothetical protein